MAKNILLVEDSITMQKVVEMTFSAEEFDLTTVASGAEAMESVESIQPDIVITDLSLDGPTGYDVCKTIKQKNGLPVLLLHGSAASYNETKARAAGADGEIAKPFETQALIDKVKALTAAGVKPAEIDQEAAAAEPAAPAQRPKRRTVPPPLPTRPKRVTKGPPPPPPPTRPRTTPPPPPRPARPEPEAQPAAPPPIMEAPTVAVKAPPVMEPEPEEIVIEAELPPQTSAEPLPSFESQTQDRLARPVEVSSPKDAPADTVTLRGFEAPDDLPEPPPGLGVPAEPPQAAEAAPAVDPAAYEAIAKLSKEIIEKVVWEVVPDMAERIIREELDRLVVEKRR